MEESTGAIGTILQLVLGGGGSLVLVLYALWAGTRGQWLFGAVHNEIVAAFEKRLEEATVQLEHERERAEMWQDRYVSVTGGTSDRP